MKSTKSIILALGLLVPTLAFADNTDRPHRPEGGRGDRGERGEHRPMVPPLMAALDANQDGTVDAAEIQNASAALLKLDKNGDGQLTRDEIGHKAPKPPKGPRPPKPGSEGADGPQ